MVSFLNGQVQDQGGGRTVEVLCESDWGGDWISRRSTTSTTVIVNKIACLSDSLTQKLVATLSCEAETLVGTSAASGAMLVRSLWSFLVYADVSLVLRCGSSSARQCNALELAG